VKIALLVSGGVPNPAASGGAVTAWTVMSHLLGEGHEVAVCVLRDPELYDPTDTATVERVERVRALGARVVEVVSGATAFFRTRPRGLGERLRRAWRPQDEELYPSLVDREAVREAVGDLGSEVAFVYHFEALAAGRGLGIPRFAAVGDPPHLSALYRFRDELPHPRALRRLVRLQAQIRHQPRLLVRYLNECESSGAFAAHHAAWLRSRGAAGCDYLRTPIPDPGGERPARARRTRKPRILLVGHLKGIVTLDGLRIFANDVLPRLERALGEDGFEARILGGYDPPPELAVALDRPAVRFLGHVEDPAEEFDSASVMLVPNSISLGVRVRILTGFSFGACIVSHHANALGIPELEHRRNALLGGSGPELAGAVLDALSDRRLRLQLQEGARRTYDECFAPPVAARRIAERLERVARPTALTSAAR
jgi:glycosyltransferase involved in cell wall biosynthesis